MIRKVVLLLAVLPPPCWALSREAQEFIDIARALEPLQCERRKLSELEPLVRASRDPQDLDAISRQHREAFYRCE